MELPSIPILLLKRLLQYFCRPALLLMDCRSETRKLRQRREISPIRIAPVLVVRIHSCVSSLFQKSACHLDWLCQWPAALLKFSSDGVD